MKRLLATLKIATRALRRNLLRTLLTMLGMIIGVGAVIAMVGIGNGAKLRLSANRQHGRERCAGVLGEF